MCDRFSLWSRHRTLHRIVSQLVLSGKLHMLSDQMIGSGQEYIHAVSEGIFADSYLSVNLFGGRISFRVANPATSADRRTDLPPRRSVSTKAGHWRQEHLSAINCAGYPDPIPIGTVCPQRCPPGFSRIWGPDSTMSAIRNAASCA